VRDEKSFSIHNKLKKTVRAVVLAIKCLEDEYRESSLITGVHYVTLPIGKARPLMEMVGYCARLNIFSASTGTSLST